MPAEYIWNPQFKDSMHALRLHTIDQVFSLKATLIARGPISWVMRMDAEDSHYFVKCYTQSGKHLRRFIGRSRLRAEYENLQFFAACGIPTAPIVAFSEERKFGLFQRGYLITDEIQNTRDLAEIAAVNDPRLHDRHWVRCVSKQIACHTATLHRHGFIHNDLKWRNILVQDTTEPKVYFIDCPVGRRRFGILRKRGIMKDLACLDKLGCKHLTRTDRLYFYKAYTGKQRIDRQDKVLIKRAVHFFDDRD
jgi:tRNA A-37 threonylcarbamoyl transferase component Bud32